MADALNGLMDGGAYGPEVAVFGMEQRLVASDGLLEMVLLLGQGDAIFAELAEELGTEHLAVKPRAGDAGVGVAKVRRRRRLPLPLPLPLGVLREARRRACLGMLPRSPRHPCSPRVLATTPCPPPASLQLTCGKDLALYTAALADNRQLLPANTLSYPHPPLSLPEALPTELVVEPWVRCPALSPLPSPPAPLPLGLLLVLALAQASPAAALPARAVARVRVASSSRAPPHLPAAGGDAGVCAARRRVAGGGVAGREPALR